MLALILLCHLARSKKILFELFSPSSTTSSYHSEIQVGFYEDDGGFDTTDGIEISLSLSPESTLIGTASCTTSGGGYCSINDQLRTKYSGTYNFLASASGYTSATSPSFTVTGTSKFSSLTLTSSNTSPTPSTSFTILVSIFDSENSITTDSCSFSLSESGGSTITGTTSSTVTGSGSFPISFATIGSKTIVGTCDSITGSVTITVGQPILKITSFTPPSSPSQTFSLTVGVYDSSGGTLQTSNGPYSISLTLSPTGGFSGTLTDSTVNGEVIFSDLKISDSGTYSITAGSDDFVSATTDQFTIKRMINKIIATPSKSTVEAYESFTIKVELYETDELLYDLSADIIIIEKNSEKFNGPEKVSTSNGKASISLYFYESGDKIVQFYVGKVFSGVEITVEDLENPDIRCKKSSSSTFCTDCVPGAILFDGICTCSLNSEYSYDDHECLCDEGYKRINDYCIKECGNFYSSTDIVGKFSYDFSTIYLTFSTKPTEEFTCKDFLILPSSLSSIKFYCIWDNILTLSIHLREFTQINDLIIGVDPFKLQKSSSECTIEIEQLDVIISYTFNLPEILASIDAPDKVSLTCSNRDLHISTPNIGRDYIYKWSSEYSPSNEIITDLISSSKGSFIDIPIRELNVGTLTVTLSISSQSFKTSAKVTKNIEIVSSPHLTIELSTGSMINIKKSSNLSIRPKIKETCGKSVFNYTWSYVSENVALNFTEILYASSGKNNLLIKKNTLKPGNSYEFMVSVTDGAATGSSSTTVVVDESPLEIYFSRSNGKIGTETDFYLHSSVVDPDSESSVIQYAWSCSEGVSNCLDAKGKTLLEVTDKDYIYVAKSKLRDSAVYVFNLEASTSTMSQSMSVEIEVKTGLKGQVYIKKSNERVNTDSNLAVIPTVTGIDLSSITWKVLMGDSITLIQGYSFLTIPANTLTSGVTYEFQVSLTKSGFELTSIYSFSTNSPASCDSLKYESISSKKINLYGESCVDGDDSDYPLTYQFGVEYKETMLWVSSAISSKEFTFLVRPYVVQGYLRVCDSLSSCSLLSASISTRRDLDEVSDSFEEDTSDLESIPSAIIYYSSIATEDTLEKMTEKLIEYIEGTIVDSSELDTISTIAYSLFTSKTNVNATQTNIVINALIEILENIDFELTDSQVTSIYAVADSQIYLISTKSIRRLINIVRYRWINNRVPYSEITFSSTLFVTHVRGLQSDYKNLKISGSNLNLTFPEEFLGDLTNVIDFSFSKFYKDNSPVFELKVFFSGQYENYTLTLETPEIYTGEFSNSIELEYESSEFDSDSICQSIDYMSWTETSCKIESLDEFRVKLDLSQTSIFNLVELENSSDLPSIYRSIIYLLLLIGITFLIFIYFNDKDIDIVSDSKTLLDFYPITSIMQSQARSWRLLQALHLVSSQSLLLLLIGGLYLFFPQSDGFIVENASKSGICLCILQVYSLVSFLLIFQSLHIKKIECLFYALSLLITIASYICIIIISFQNSEKFIFNWIFGFLLYSPIDIVVIHFIYALIKSKLTKSNSKLNLDEKFNEFKEKTCYIEVTKIVLGEENILNKKNDKSFNEGDLLSKVDNSDLINSKIDLEEEEIANSIDEKIDLKSVNSIKMNKMKEDEIKT